MVIAGSGTDERSFPVWSVVTAIRTDYVRFSMVEILKFGAEWCDPCTQQAAILDELITERDEEITIRDVDVEERGNRDLKRRFEPRALPTTVILVDDEPVRQFNGLVSKADLHEALDEILSAPTGS